MYHAKQAGKVIEGSPALPSTRMRATGDAAASPSVTQCHRQRHPVSPKKGLWRNGLGGMMTL